MKKILLLTTLLITSCTSKSIKRNISSVDKISDVHFHLNSTLDATSELEKNNLTTEMNRLIERNIKNYKNLVVISEAFMNWRDRDEEDNNMVKFIEDNSNSNTTIYGLCSVNSKRSETSNYLDRCLNLNTKIIGVKLHLSELGDFCMNHDASKFLNEYTAEKATVSENKFYETLDYLNSLEQKKLVLIHAKNDPCPTFKSEAKEWIKVVEKYKNIVFIFAHVGNLELIKQATKSEKIKKNNNLFFDTAVSNLYINDDYISIVNNYHKDTLEKGIDGAHYPSLENINYNKADEFVRLVGLFGAEHFIFGSDNQPLDLNCETSYISDPETYKFKNKFESNYGDYLYCYEGPEKKNNVEFLKSYFNNNELKLILHDNLDQLIQRLTK